MSHDIEPDAETRSDGDAPETSHVEPNGANGWSRRALGGASRAAGKGKAAYRSKVKPRVAEVAERVRCSEAVNRAKGQVKQAVAVGRDRLEASWLSENDRLVVMRGTIAHLGRKAADNPYQVAALVALFGFAAVAAYYGQHHHAIAALNGDTLSSLQTDNLFWQIRHEVAQAARQAAWEVGKDASGIPAW